MTHDASHADVYPDRDAAETRSIATRLMTIFRGHRPDPAAMKGDGVLAQLQDDRRARGLGPGDDGFHVLDGDEVKCQEAPARLRSAAHQFAGR